MLISPPQNNPQKVTIDMLDNLTSPLPTAAEITPYLLSVLSLSCAYFLNNHKVMLGRYLGLASAILWGGYGAWVGQWFFLVNHSVFALIYISAIIKFGKKHDSYKQITEEQRIEIERLKNEIEQSHRQKSKELMITQKKVAKIARLHKKQLTQGLTAINSLLAAVNEPNTPLNQKERRFSKNP